MKLATVVFVLLAACLGVTAEAQIVGTVVDTEEHPIQWATVNASRLMPNGVRQFVGWAWTDYNGQFTVHASEWLGYYFEPGEYLLEIDGWEYLMTRVPVTVSSGYGDAGETQLIRGLQGVGVDFTYDVQTRTVRWNVLVNGQVSTSSRLTTRTLVTTPAKTESFTFFEKEQPRFPVPQGKYLNHFQIPAQIPEGTYVCGSIEIYRTGDRLNIRSSGQGWCVLIRSDDFGNRQDVAWTRSGMASWKQLQ